MTEKELRRILGAEYDRAIKETMSTLTLPITKEKLIAALLKANKLYWVRRLSQIDTFFTANAEACAAALAVPYIAASKTFADRVKSIYTAYESAFDLSHKDAKELLNKVVYDRSIAESLRKIADDMPDGEEKTRILAEISAPAYRYRLERAEAMCKQAQEVCDEIAVGEVSAVREFLQTETERAYNLTVEGFTEPTPADTIIESIAPEPIQLRFNEMPKASEPVRELTPTPVQTGVHDSFTLVSEKNVREIVEHDWSGREFSKSIWNHTDDLAKEIKQVLIEGELTGASEVDMTAKIAERFDVAMGRARCVVRTESNYCTNQAELKALKGAGIEFYEYAALHDERISEICDALNGKTFPLKDAVVGVNYPPMHPNCRSSVMPVLQTEDDLDRELEEMMRQAGAPEDMSLEDFVEHLTPSEDGTHLVFDPNQKYDNSFKPLENNRGENKDTSVSYTSNSSESVDFSEKRGIIETGGKVEGGKITEENWMQYDKYEQQAADFYEARINNDDDIVAISKNTGFGIEDVTAIKNHVMVDEHTFQDGSVRKFDPSIDQALAWQRLMKGEQKDEDILLLKHELRELEYMKETGCDYETAHAYSSEKYDWQAAVDKMLDKDSIDPELLK